MSNSKQTNFFIVPKDWPEIRAFFEKNNVIFFKGPILDENNFLPSNPELINSEGTYQVYLTKKEYQRKILLKQQKEDFDIDIVRSYVIEFNRGGFYPYSNKVLNRARFYTVTRYLEDGHNKNKDQGFIEWVEAIYREFKKSFLRKTNFDKDFPFSENAIKWIIENKAKVDVTGLKAISNSEKEG